MQLAAGKIAGTGEAMGDNALDVDVGVLGCGPHLHEDVFAGAVGEEGRIRSAISCRGSSTQRCDLKKVKKINTRRER